MGDPCASAGSDDVSIFISYRRQDGSGYAGRVFDRLKARFGSERVFLDVTDIEPGLDFVEAIEKAVGSCDALVVVIGRHWSRLLAEKAKGDDPDFVGLEVATALDRNVRVVPVLVGNAVMPRPGDLPDAVKTLARRQAITISDDRWDFDVDRLIGALERVVKAPADATDEAGSAERQPAASDGAASQSRPVPAALRSRFLPDLSSIAKVDHRTWQWAGELPAPVEEAVEVGRRALASAGMSNAVVSQGRVTAGAGPSLKSLGEEVWIEFTPIDATASRAMVVSRSRVATTLFDWGKNRQNIEKIIAELAEVIR